MRIVLTFTGRDTPGIVHQLADVVRAHGGNWQDSRMARLAGRFTGILDILIADDDEASFRAGLATLEAQGVRFLVDSGDDSSLPAPRRIRLECTAMDRPGIVQALTEVMVGYNITITELSTTSMETPMAGGFLFRATAVLAIADTLNTSQLHNDLEAIASDLLVELHEDHS